MRVLNEEVPQNISDYAATLPYSEAKKIYADYKNKEIYIPYSAPEENPNEIILDETYADEQHPEGAYTFNITTDAGIYRIRTETYYHGTKRIGYTDVFKVTSIL